VVYSRIEFWRFDLGVGVVSLPLLAMREDNKYAWPYVGLLLLSFAVFHSKSLASAGQYFGKELKP
jgi:hypothetical protein